MRGDVVVVVVVRVAWPKFASKDEIIRRTGHFTVCWAPASLVNNSQARDDCSHRSP